MIGLRPHCSVHVGALLLWASASSACMAPEDFLPLDDPKGEDSGVEGWYGHDSDEDGLQDRDEEALGTDPEDPDSDGDGFTDGDEVSRGTNPLWEHHHPYDKGNYRMAACGSPPEVEGAGPEASTQVERDGSTVAYAVYEPGDLVWDGNFVDEWGQKVHFWNACGLTVWVIVGAEDSERLIQAAVEIPALMTRHAAYSWTPVLVLRADHQGGLPTAERLTTWRESMGLDGVPVVAPANLAQQENLMAFDVDGQDPSTAILGQDLRVMTIDQDVGLDGGLDVEDWFAD